MASVAVSRKSFNTVLTLSSLFLSTDENKTMNRVKEWEEKMEKKSHRRYATKTKSQTLLQETNQKQENTCSRQMREICDLFGNQSAIHFVVGALYILDCSER